MRRFAYRLAFHLGRANVDGMLRELTCGQLMEWMVFSDLEPFGEDRQDARAGSIVQTLVNINRNSKKHPRPFKLEECIVHPPGDAVTKALMRRQQSWQQMKEMALALAAASRGGVAWR